MIVAGTGHRPAALGGLGLTVVQKERWYDQGAAIAFAYLKYRSPTRVISGMAIGWDQMLAQAALDAGIPLTAAVPFEGQESLWPHSDQTRYAKLLGKADQTVVISSGDYRAWKMQRRNVWMVDSADRLVALFDGVSPGGTRNCISYATVKQVPVDNLWPCWTGRMTMNQWIEANADAR